MHLWLVKDYWESFIQVCSKYHWWIYGATRCALARPFRTYFLKIMGVFQNFFGEKAGLPWASTKWKSKSSQALPTKVCLVQYNMACHFFRKKCKAIKSCTGVHWPQNMYASLAGCTRVYSAHNMGPTTSSRSLCGGRKPVQEIACISIDLYTNGPHHHQGLHAW